MGRRILLLSAALCVAACGTSGGSGADGGGADGEPDASSPDTSMPQESGSPDATGGDARSDAPSHADADADADAEPRTDAETDAGTDAEADAVADAAADSAPAHDAASDAVADSAPDAAADAARDAAPDSASDSGSGHDSARESGPPDASDASIVGPITGGPCSSGAAGATAIRIEFIDAAGTADVQWLVEGDPDRSNDSAGTYGNTIGFTPSYVDQFLAQGGVALDSSDFIDIGMSTVGLTAITSATLSLYGRSYDVSTDGSFNWQTFDGTGQTATDFVSNVPPYQWYSADMTAEIGPGENNVLVRIKAGPSSNSLVVNKVEICLVAQ
jgi:hypothetical protein